jgi:hypothetical protein
MKKIKHSLKCSHKPRRRRRNFNESFPGVLTELKNYYNNLENNTDKLTLNFSFSSRLVYNILCNAHSTTLL